MFKTIEEARAFVRDVKVCTIFEAQKCKHTSLWEHLDLPDKQPGESGWGQKVQAVWRWKNQLPALHPNEIFYGKIKGGHAVLMDMTYLREQHFAKAYQPVEELSPLAQFAFEMIQQEPWETGTLRKVAIAEMDTTKSRFDTAMKHLQISMNIVRSSGMELEKDTWETFEEVYPDIWEQHVTNRE